MNPYLTYEERLERMYEHGEPESRSDRESAQAWAREETRKMNRRLQDEADRTEPNRK